MDAAPIGVLVMAYGTASGPDDIERYYTDIRGGRAPSPEHLTELQDRYAAIGNVFPLLDTTKAGCAGRVGLLVEDLDLGGRRRIGPLLRPDAHATHASAERAVRRNRRDALRRIEDAHRNIADTCKVHLFARAVLDDRAHHRAARRAQDSMHSRKDFF